MIVFGVDPGVATTGWAVIKSSKNLQQLVACGAILTSKIKDQNIRLKEIYEKITAKLDFYQPDYLVIENLFFNTNLKTAIQVSQAHGVVRLAAVNLRIKTVGYTPLEVKTSITGYGRADKKQIQYMVFKLLKLKEKINKDDVADAIAIALTHCYNMKKQV